MIGRIVRSADFERILATRPVARSSRFALHHLREAPSKAPRAALPPTAQPNVDDGRPVLVPSAQWFGLVVPKRHARRAVTRSLLKRQMRQMFFDVSPALDAGLWLIRLKAPFDRTEFSSAASSALRSAVRSELSALLGRVRQSGG